MEKDLSRNGRLDNLERGDRHEKIDRTGKDRSVRHDRNERVLGGDNEGSLYKVPREPRRPEEGDDGFGSRSRKATTRNDDLAQVQNPSRSKDQSESTNPEWMTGVEETGEDTTGKTVDDFERWKQSMRKNDGSGDTGLPPLLVDNEPEIHAAEVKEVRPPPGFGPVAPVIDSGTAFGRALSSALDAGTAGVPKLETSSPRDTIPRESGSTRTAGSSKFSKFFSPTPAKEAPKPTASVNDTFAALSGITRQGANKDDAEGFERILAMLSSQTPQPSKPPEPIASAINQAPTPSHVASHAYLPVDTNYNQRQHTSYSAFSRPNETPIYAAATTDRRSMPAMANLNAGTGPIISNHTQNQDFFSSLLNQSHELTQNMPHNQSHPQAYALPPQQGYLQPMPHGSLQPQSPAARDRQSYLQPQLNGDSSQQLPPEARQGFHRPRDAAEIEFLNHLMREQTVSRQEPYQVQYSHQNRVNRDQLRPQGHQDQLVQQSSQQGYIGGVGGQPGGPGWNGQYEIDPRIPNGQSRY